MPSKKKLQIIIIVLSTVIVLLVPIAFISYSGTITFNKAEDHTTLEIKPSSDFGEAFSFDYPYSEIEKRKDEIAQALAQSQVVTTTPSWTDYPEEILGVTRDPSDLLVLVNKTYKLPATYIPADLVSIESTGLRMTKSGMTMRSVLVSDLTQLATDIQAEGIDLSVLSTYRSYETQQITYDYWLSYNGGDVSAADMISARAGHSQHQLGTAIDFSTSAISDQIGQHFANTSAGQWLAQNAWKYGFVISYPQGYEATTGYSYEPWHFRYIGVANAVTWHSSGQILEVWLRGINGV